MYTLTVDGDVTHPLKLGIDDLRKLPTETVVFTEHGGQRKTYRGPLLIDVLGQAGVAIAEHVRGKALGVAVDVIASDGYSVVLGLGEVEPSISGRTILVAYAADDQPLGPGVGPVRLIIQDDKKQARAERMVAEIKVVDLAK